ncbi:hypothetical protein TNCV_2163211, partial [Trichonephila clavipes]
GTGVVLEVRRANIDISSHQQRNSTTAKQVTNQLLFAALQESRERDLRKLLPDLGGEDYKARRPVVCPIDQTAAPVRFSNGVELSQLTEQDCERRTILR